MKPTILSLFSGAGCFDLGFEAAGFRTTLVTDMDKDCCDTIRTNRGWTTIHSSIEGLDSSTLMKASSLKPRELDLLIGGPPCQPYSKSAFGSLGTPLGYDDSRALTIREYIRVVRDLLPKAFIIENVPQFITGKNERVKQYLERAVYRINSEKRTRYRLSFHQINAAAYGVPQMRERLFIVASRSGQSFEMPEARFFQTPDVELEMPGYITTRDAIGHLTSKFKNRKYLEVGGRWNDLLMSIPPGSNYLWHTERGGGRNVFKWRSRYWNFLLKLHPDQPSWTIAASPGYHTGPFHWENRRLATLELQLLQTIPQDYSFCGNAASIRKQIGNGVPSAIGELLGKEIRKQFFGHRCNSSSLRLIPQLRKRRNGIQLES